MSNDPGPMPLYGDTVDVTTPKHKDSPHTVAFTGTVVGFKDGGILSVRDQDDNVFDVERDEIEKVHPFEERRK